MPTGSSKPRARRGLDDLAVYQLPDGRWVAPVRRPGQRPLRIYGRSEEEAYARRRAHYDEVARGLRHPDGGAGQIGDRKIVTVADWLTYWMEEIVKPVYDPKTGRRISGVQPTTYQNRLYHVECMLHPKHGLGKIRLTELSLPDVRRWYFAMIKAGTAASSMRYARVTLANALNEGLRHQKETHLMYNAAHLFKLEHEPARAKPAPDRAALGRVLALVEGDRRQLAIELALFLGLRRQEIAALQAWDFDFVHGELHVRRRANRMRGKVLKVLGIAPPPNDRRRGIIVRDGRKMGHELSEDVLPIDVQEWQPRLAAHRQRALEWYALHRDEWTGLDPRHEHAFLFCNERGQMLDPQRLWAWCHEIFAQAGVPDKSLHGLRHDFNGILHEAGVNLTDRSRALRHASTAVTDAIYTHLPEDRIRMTISKASQWMAADGGT